jgi:hypothetical protein
MEAFSCTTLPSPPPSSPEAPDRCYHAVTTAVEEPDRRPKIALDNVGIPLGGRQVSMPREALDGRGRVSPPEELRDEEVPQAVEREPRGPQPSARRAGTPGGAQNRPRLPHAGCALPGPPAPSAPPAGPGEARRGEPPARALTSAERSTPARWTASPRGASRRGQCPPCGAPSLPPPGGPRRPPGRTPARCQALNAF